jgi:hypothetical protein
MIHIMKAVNVDARGKTMKKIHKPAVSKGKMAMPIAYLSK